MEVFRLVREKFATPLSGKGAASRGARWNSVGIELIYTAGNRSLAMAEVAVHFTLATLPDDYTMITLHIPASVSRKKLQVKNLPPNWNEFPYPSTTLKIGDAFVQENKYCILIIPSVVTQGEYNILINPNHPEFKKIKVKKKVRFTFDKRLFK